MDLIPLAQAGDALVAELGERPAPSPEIEELCVRIRETIRAKRPPDEDSLVEADPEGEAVQIGPFHMEMVRMADVHGMPSMRS